MRQHRGLISIGRAALAFRSLATASLLVTAGAFMLAASAADENDPEEPGWLKNMRRRIADLTMSVEIDGERRNVEVIEQPILRHTDPARAETEGTVWAWGRSGRPAAVLTMFVGQNLWNFEFVSLADDTLRVRRSGAVAWRPTADFEMQAVEDGKYPSETEAARLRSMRQIARRFTATETYMNQKIELRLLSQPLPRYADRDSGLIDGGLFTFAHGTNPEILLFVECRRPESGADQWSYGFARMAAADLSVRRGEDEIWSRPSAFNRRMTDPYYVFYGPYDPAEVDEVPAGKAK